MCGIFLYSGSKPNEEIMKHFMSMQHRGPDNTHIYIQNKLWLGFHRLMINDLTDDGDQPMIRHNSILMCNGEIYNHKEIKDKYNLECESQSDCEVIIACYNYLKQHSDNLEEIVQKLCTELDGEFAFIIIDNELQRVIAARDRYGVRPLFVGYDPKTNNIGFASEMKALNDLLENVEQFAPSVFSIFHKLDFSNSITMNYHTIAGKPNPDNNDLSIILPEIKTLFERAVIKRVENADVPVCCLLSGGLDSSLVAAIAADYLKKSDKKLHTFSIGLEGSTDLQYAKIVAEHIDSIHHEVIVTEKQMLDAIPTVIKAIESYDITTVRASVPHYLISKYIKENTNFIVVISGEMSDEILGGYLYFKYAPNSEAFCQESDRLLEEICYFDNLRADRSICAHGLEARAPFSDHYFVNWVQNINADLRESKDNIEKYLLRKAFEEIGLLPESVVWRVKNAFSDAVSKKERSWYQIIQDYVDSIISDNEYQEGKAKYQHLPPISKESYFYRKIFTEFYKHDNVIPHFWMPNQTWCVSTDPSARTLNVYNESTLTA